MSLHNGKAYQIECPACRSVAGLHAKAGLLQAYINRVLPRSFSPHAYADDLTLRPNSGALSPGLSRSVTVFGVRWHSTPAAVPAPFFWVRAHAEVGTGGFCGTHNKSATPRSAASVMPREMR